MVSLSELDAARLFVNVAQDLMTQPDLAATRERVVSMAVKLTGCTSAALGAVRSPAELAVIASTDLPLATQVARIATETAEGPVVQAQARGQRIACEDFWRERRWRHYAQRVLSETVIRSEVCYPLQLEGCDFGVLSLYSDQAGYFDDDVCAVAELHAGHALLALVHAKERNRAANLEVGLVSNREIGIAIGVLMTAHRITDQQAFDMLRNASQHGHLKLRDVAAEVVLTGELPAAPSRSSSVPPTPRRSLAVVA